MTQAPLPPKDRTLQAALVTALTRLETQPRVVGGMMSRRAYSRSVRVSSVGSKSDSLEISDSGRAGLLLELDVRAGDAGLGQKHTGISEVVILHLGAQVGVLEVLILDFCESNHFGGLCINQAYAMLREAKNASCAS